MSDTDAEIARQRALLVLWDWMRGDGRHDAMPFDNNKVAQLFHCASDALGSNAAIEAPWRMADWIIAHHNAALDQRERDYLLRWAAARRAMVMPTTPPN